MCIRYSVILPASITKIEAQGFNRCPNLKSITLPSSITKIGAYAFSGSTALTTIKFEGTVDQWNAISFGSLWDDEIESYSVVCTDGTINKPQISE